MDEYDIDAMLDEEENMDAEYEAQQREMETFEEENGFGEPDDVDKEVSDQHEAERPIVAAATVAAAPMPAYAAHNAKRSRPLRMTPEEMAMALQHTRSKALAGGGVDTSAQHNALNVTELATRTEAIPRLSSDEARRYLHARPVISDSIGRGSSSGAGAESGSLVKSAASSSSSSSSGSSSNRRSSGVGDDSAGADGSSRGLAHMTCVLANGERVFLAKRRRHVDMGTHAANAALPGEGLLASPMAVLQEEALQVQVHSETQRRAREEAQRAGMARAVAASGMDVTDGIADTAEKDLWVSKHSPRAFSQLLSAERTNRDVLRAIKAWDPFVFKKSALPPPARVSFGGNAGAATAAAGGTPKSAAQTERDAAYAAAAARRQAEDPRPEYKVILLSGPPGTGKTTLAHIVAKHCGYRPYEINASDDRTAAVLKDKLTGAMLGNTIDADGRPNCLILDEIDGIDSRSSIEALAAIVRAPLKRKGKKASPGDGDDDDDEEESSSKEKSSGRRGGIALTRPLICICNDQYAPVLRDLRKYCQIFAFQPTQEKRLVMRLKAICVNEGLRVSTDSLGALAAASNGDVRSCLNTMQFAALRLGKTGTGASASPSKDRKGSSGRQENLGDVLSSILASGLKDRSRDVFQVWREAFSQQAVAVVLAAKRARSAPAAEKFAQPTAAASPSVAKKAAAVAAAAAAVGPLMEVMSAMQECGDSALIIRGLFHNLPRVHYHDPSFSRTALAAEWLSGCDMLEGRCFGSSGDGFALMAYLPATAAAVHMLCSSDGRTKVEWPKQASDEHYKQLQNEHILQSLQLGARSSGSDANNSSTGGVPLGIHALSQTLRSRDNVVTDLLPALMDIISPRVRPVAFITLSPGEQGALQRAVRAMASTGLAFRMQQREGLPRWNQGHQQPQQHQQQVSLELEPAVHQLLRFEPCPELGTRRWQLPYETKNNLFMELKRYLIQQSEAATTAGNSNGEGSADAADSPSSATAAATSAAAAATVGTPGSPVGRRGSSKAATSTPHHAASAASPAGKRALLAAMASPQATLEVAQAGSAAKRARTADGKATIDPSLAPQNLSRRWKAIPDKSGANGGSFFKSKGANEKDKADAAAAAATATAQGRGTSQSLAQARASAVRFKFNQGFSNAVRRPVNIRDFL